MADPAAHKQAVEQAVAPLRDAAPDTATAFVKAATAGTAWLATQLPKMKTDPATSLQPEFASAGITDLERDRFLRAARAVDQPLSIVQQMTKGIAPTREEVAALRNVYPALYAELLHKLQVKVNELDKPLPYEKQRSLEQLVGMDARSMRPSFVKQMQSSFAPRPPAPSGKSRGGKRTAKLEGLDAQVALSTFGPTPGRRH
jgi:hypothetical protein